MAVPGNLGWVWGHCMSESTKSMLTRVQEEMQKPLGSQSLCAHTPVQGVGHTCGWWHQALDHVSPVVGSMWRPTGAQKKLSIHHHHFHFDLSIINCGGHRWLTLTL